MRKFLIGAALAATALAAAAPAAAQYARPYGYATAYGYNSAYNNGYGNGRALEWRVQRIQQQIRILDQHNVLSDREARRLDWQAQRLRQDVRRLAWNGVSPRERFDVEQRIVWLERQVRINANDRDGRFDRGNGNYHGDDQRDRWQDRDGNWHNRD